MQLCWFNYNGEYVNHSPANTRHSIHWFCGQWVGNGPGRIQDWNGYRRVMRTRAWERKINYKITLRKPQCILTLMWHRWPVYPLVHLHENPPIWSVHCPLFRHGLDSHSLYSKLQSSPEKPVTKWKLKWKINYSFSFFFFFVCILCLVFYFFYLFFLAHGWMQLYFWLVLHSLGFLFGRFHQKHTRVHSNHTKWVGNR